MNISRMFTKKPLASIVSLGTKGKLGLSLRDEFPEMYDGDTNGETMIWKSIMGVPMVPDVTGKVLTLQPIDEVEASISTATNTFVTSPPYGLVNCFSFRVSKLYTRIVEHPGSANWSCYVMAVDLSDEIDDNGFPIAVSTSFSVIFSINVDTDGTEAATMFHGETFNDELVNEAHQITEDDTVYVTYDEGTSGNGRMSVYLNSLNSTPIITTEYSGSKPLVMPSDFAVLWSIGTAEGEPASNLTEAELTLDTFLTESPYM